MLYKEVQKKACGIQAVKRKLYTCPRDVNSNFRIYKTDICIFNLVRLSDKKYSWERGVSE